MLKRRVVADIHRKYRVHVHVADGMLLLLWDELKLPCLREPVERDLELEGDELILVSC